MAEDTNNFLDAHGLQTLIGKIKGWAASATHTHNISDVNNLQSTLDGKASSSHTHTIAQVTDLQNQLNGKAASSHTHDISQITGIKIQSGVATDIGGTANTTVYRHVSLSGFSSVPSVNVTAQSTTPNNCAVSVSNVTTSGFDIRLWRSNTADTDVFWVAIGK